jgi:hypothetical protein
MLTAVLSPVHQVHHTAVRPRPTRRHHDPIAAMLKLITTVTAVPVDRPAHPSVVKHSTNSKSKPATPKPKLVEDTVVTVAAADPEEALAVEAVLPKAVMLPHHHRGSVMPKPTILTLSSRFVMLKLRLVTTEVPF